MRMPNPEKLFLVRLTLGNFMDYIDAIMEWINDPAVTFYFAGMQKKKNREEEIEFYRNLLVSKADVVYSILNNAGECVGQVSINKIDWIGETGRVFLAITPKKQGNGYFYGAVKAIEDAGFTEIGLNKLWIIIRYESEMELKYRKCGFEPEGVLKEEYRIGDKRYDMIRMAILKEDYENWWAEEKTLFFEGRWNVFNNFSAWRVFWKDRLWMTSEHAYQAAKFEDEKIIEEIFHAHSAYDAKKIARKHQSSVRADWHGINLFVMEEIVRAKLDQYPYIQRKLRETGDMEIIEDSPYDPFWGRGPDWKGQNHLGKIWMKLREELKGK